ncbi:MAG: type II secretion system F family protein [Endomicrobiales bacterium]|nr:type II secretion system F family protein [Endomicrobiales bacterium]
MPKFLFRARNANNELVEGSRMAASERELVAMLNAEGLVVFSVTGAKGSKTSKGGAAPAAEKTAKGSVRVSVTLQEIAVFCRQLATLINAGVPILESIDDVSEMSVRLSFKKMLKEIANDIRGGSTMSDSMKKYQSVFGRVFVSLVAAGERSGKLAKILLDLALYLENTVKLKRKVQAASMYPAFVAGFFLLALGGLVFFLIPKFKAMFASFGAQLPTPTLITIAISEFMIQNIPYLMIVFAGVVLTFAFWYKTSSGRMIMDTALLNLPIFGEINRKIVFARFFQTFATLLKSGNDIVVSLEVAARVADNAYVESKILEIRTKVIEGSTVSDEMMKMAVFPKMVARMTSVGEKSGKLDEMFEKISDYYTDEVDAAVVAMSSIIEPILIVSLGGLIGVVVIVMYLPIFKLGSAMMKQ